MIDCEQAYQDEMAKFDELIELLKLLLENQRILAQDIKNLNAVIGVKGS